MNRGKKLLILGIALLALCGGTWLASLITVDPSAQEDVVSTTTIFTLDADAVTSVQWEYSETLAFDKEGDTWVYRDNSKFPVESSYLDAIFEALSSVDSYKTIENIENWDTYGLEIPVCTISVTAGETYDLAIGIETTMGGQRYFSIGDGKAYLVDSTILEPFQYDLYDLLAAQELPQMEQVTAMTVKTPDGSYTLSYDPESGRTYSDDYVWFWEDTALDPAKAQSLIRSVTNLNLAQCENYDAQDLAVYGLDDPELTISIWDNGSLAYTLSVSAAEDGRCYVLLPGTTMVYSVDDSFRQSLRYTTTADLLPADVLRMDWDTVDSVTVTLDDTDYVFTRQETEVSDEEGNVTTEVQWLLDGEETALSDILTTLTGLSSSGYATGMTPEGTPQVTFRIHRQRDTFSQVELSAYSYSSESCIITLDGTPTVTVSRQSMADLVQSLKDLVTP